MVFTKVSVYTMRTLLFDSKTVDVFFCSSFISCSCILCLDKPHVIDSPSITINETDRVVLTKEIASNPLSNVSWYNGSELLLTQYAVRTATFIIQKATCTDTKNFTLIASNIVERNVSALVEVIVNCKWSFSRKLNRNYTNSFVSLITIDFLR